MYIKIFIRILAVAVLFCLAAVVYLNISQFSQPAIKDSDQKPTPATSTTAIHTRDSDGDGLNDWQERLLGTNPRLVDSDGDGTDDATEVQLGQDPTYAGQPTPQPVRKLDDSGLYKEFEFTAGQADVDVNQLFELLQQQAGADQPAPSDSQPADTASPNQQELRTALNHMGAVISTYQTTLDSDVAVYDDLFARVERDYSRIEQIIADYQTISTELEPLEVPAIVAVAHRDLYQSYGIMAERLQILLDSSLSQEDFLEHTLAYDEAIRTWQAAMVSLHGLVQLKKFNFSPTEGGYLFETNL